MRRYIPLWMGTAALLSSSWLTASGAQPGSGPAVGKVVAGEIQLPEISGAAFLPGDRLLVVGDEKMAVFLLEQASQRLMTGTVAATDFKPVDLKNRLKGAGGSRKLDDLEDVASDGKSSLFLVTSHSRSRRGQGPGPDDKPERYAIARLGFGADGLAAGDVPVLDLQIPEQLKEASLRTAAQSGFNIEGAVWKPDGRLLLGLRSPTRTAPEKRDTPNEDALLLEIKNPAANPMKVEGINALDLRGGGIRGMAYDPDERGLWILAGLSPDPPDGMVQAEWALWFLEDGGKLSCVALPAEAKNLTNAEAVARVSLGEPKQPYLLLVEDRPGSSRYLLFPVPRSRTVMTETMTLCTRGGPWPPPSS